MSLAIACACLHDLPDGLCPPIGRQILFLQDQFNHGTHLGTGRVLTKPKAIRPSPSPGTNFPPGDGSIVCDTKAMSGIGHRAKGLGQKKRGPKRNPARLFSNQFSSDQKTRNMSHPNYHQHHHCRSTPRLFCLRRWQALQLYQRHSH